LRASGPTRALLQTRIDLLDASRQKAFADAVQKQRT